MTRLITRPERSRLITGVAHTLIAPPVHRPECDQIVLPSTHPWCLRPCLPLPVLPHLNHPVPGRRIPPNPFQPSISAICHDFIPRSTQRRVLRDNRHPHVNRGHLPTAPPRALGTRCGSIRNSSRVSPCRRHPPGHSRPVRLLLAWTLSAVLGPSPPSPWRRPVAT